MITEDENGALSSEVALPRDGILNFRIPENINVGNESIVEVRDRNTSIRREKFGSIATPLTKAEGTGATIMVSGKLSPVSKVDVHPSTVDFTNTITGRTFSAVVTNGQYSIQLPNNETYRVTLTWALTPGSQTGTAQDGILNLNVNTQSHYFDIDW